MSVEENGISRREIVRRAITETVRVVREGGVGRVEIQHPESGQLTSIEIDQARAQDILCGLNDTLAAGSWKQHGEGQQLCPKDREFLRMWTAATIAESEDAERERRTESKKRRSQLYLVKSDIVPLVQEGAGEGESLTNGEGDAPISERVPRDSDRD